jgi:hypothetical protein
MKLAKTILFAALLAALSLTGCRPNVQAVTANAIAIAVDAAGEQIAAREKAEGLAAIDAAPDEDAAHRALDIVRQRYVPVWAGYDALAASHEAWRAVLVARGQPSPEMALAVLAAFCALQSLLDEVGVKLPDLLPCGGLR